jgi:hypothetical protein
VDWLVEDELEGLAEVLVWSVVELELVVLGVAEFWGVVSGMVDGVLTGSSVLVVVVVEGDVEGCVVLGAWVAGRVDSVVVDGFDCAAAHSPNASRNVPVSATFLMLPPGIYPLTSISIAFFLRELSAKSGPANNFVKVPTGYGFAPWRVAGLVWDIR